MGRVRDELTRGVPLLGVLPRLLRDPAGLAVDIMCATDAVVPLRVGPATVYFLHHSDHLRHILLDNYRNYPKGPIFARAEMMLGIAWTWYLLATHPESARRARDEVLRVMPEGDPSFEQLGQLEYLGRIFQDALRL